MTASLNEDLEKQLYHDLTQGREDIEDVTREPNRQQHQGMVEFSQRGRRCHQELYATQAGSCGVTAQINDRHSGYWIRCKRNKPILALNQQQNI